MLVAEAGSQERGLHRGAGLLELNWSKVGPEPRMIPKKFREGDFSYAQKIGYPRKGGRKMAYECLCVILYWWNYLLKIRTSFLVVFSLFSPRRKWILPPTEGCYCALVIFKSSLWKWNLTLELENTIDDSIWFSHQWIKCVLSRCHLPNLLFMGTMFLSSLLLGGEHNVISHVLKSTREEKKILEEFQPDCWHFLIFPILSKNICHNYNE